MMTMRASYLVLIAAALFTTAGCGGVEGVDVPGEITEALTGPTVVANMSPAGLIESTGNLYWTTNGTTGIPRQFVASVFRASKTNVPGSEVLLYRETSSLPVTFGNITFANVGGNWYGYFVATYFSTGSVIKRVPLDGGTAVTIGDSPQLISPQSALLNDGSFLYFYDANGLYNEPITGGATIIMSTTPNITAIALDPIQVYFSAGTTIYQHNKHSEIHSVFATTSDPVQALAIKLAPAGSSTFYDTVYWAEGRNVFSQTQGGKTYWGGPAMGHVVTALSFDGSRVLWTDCNAADSTACTVEYRSTAYAGGGLNVTGKSARLVQGDASQIFYVTANGLFRSSY